MYQKGKKGSDFMKKIPSFSLKQPSIILQSLSTTSNHHEMVLTSNGGEAGAPPIDGNLSTNNSNHVVYYVCDENTGCCIYHPEIQLRKRARFGGWKDVLKQCPKCYEIGVLGSSAPVTETVTARNQQYHWRQR